MIILTYKTADKNLSLTERNVDRIFWNEAVVPARILHPRQVPGRGCGPVGVRPARQLLLGRIVSLRRRGRGRAQGSSAREAAGGDVELRAFSGADGGEGGGGEAEAGADKTPSLVHQRFVLKMNVEQFK